MKLKQTRLLILCCGSLSIAILVILLVTRNSLINTQYQFVKNESQKVNHIFSLLVSESLKEKHVDLINVATDKRNNRLSFYDFIAVFVMGNKDGKLVEKFSDSITHIPSGYGHVILNKLPTQVEYPLRVEYPHLESQINLQPIKSTDGVDLIAMITKHKGNILIGLFKNKFPAMVQKFILDHSEVVLMNKQGFVLASSSTYGQKIESPITRAIQNNSFNTQELFHYSDHFQEMVSSIASLADTNLYASVSTSHGIIYSYANKVSKNILMIGIAVVLISVGIILAFSIKLSEESKEPERHKPKPANNTEDIKKGFKRYESLERVTLSELGNQRKNAFREFSSFVSSKTTGPLASAIGHIQIIKAKNSNQTLERHLEKGERAIRDVQDIVSKLAQFSNTDFREKTTLDVNQTLNDTIRLMEYNLTGIAINTNFNKPKPVLANQAQLKQVFYDLISKILDDMKLVNTSELFLETKNIDTLVNITFKYLSNEGFDPLPYSDKNLNLAACLGIIEEHGGSITPSLDGGGTVITLTLPVLNKDVYLKNQVLTNVNISSPTV